MLETNLSLLINTPIKNKTWSGMVTWAQDNKWKDFYYTITKTKYFVLYSSPERTKKIEATFVLDKNISFQCFFDNTSHFSINFAEKIGKIIFFLSFTIKFIILSSIRTFQND